MIDQQIKENKKILVQEILIETIERKLFWVPEQIITLNSQIKESNKTIKNLENVGINLSREVEKQTTGLALKGYRIEKILNIIAEKNKEIANLKQRIKFLNKNNRRLEKKLTTLIPNKNSYFSLKISQDKNQRFVHQFILQKKHSDDGELRYNLQILYDLSYEINIISDYFPELFTLGILLNKKERLTSDINYVYADINSKIFQLLRTLDF